jgi:hypothetical protein
MALAKIVGGFLAIWFLFYLVAYLLFITPDSGDAGPKSADNRNLNVADSPFAKQKLSGGDNVGGASIGSGEFILPEDMTPSRARPALLSDPFVSASCSYSIQKSAAVESGLVATVGVVIPVRNEHKNDVLRTVSEILWYHTFISVISF